MKKMLDAEGCRAFSNNFQDLYGMEQLPGLASQHLMAQGYGYGGEGDWKVAAMTAILKAMSEGQSGGTAFMEDYTYHLEPGNEYSLGAHMLEVCPSVAAARTPHRGASRWASAAGEPPARLVFEGREGAGHRGEPDRHGRPAASCSARTSSASSPSCPCPTCRWPG